MKPRIQIRKPGVCVPPDEAEAAGTTEWLPIEEAAQRIAYDGAEPFFESPDHEPKLPPDGCSFSEAFRLWVLEHPLVQEWFGEDRPPIPQLCVALYLKEPVWRGIARESAARQLGKLNTHPR